MSERGTTTTIRGARLGGAGSYEAEREGAEYEPRRRHTYTCGLGHVTTVVFHAEAEAPAEWECAVCPVPARHDEHHAATAEPATKRTVTKTHWEQLRSRRSEAELETLLAEALSNYRQYGKAF